MIKTEKGGTDPANLFNAVARIPASKRAVSITSYEVHQGD